MIEQIEPPNPLEGKRITYNFSCFETTLETLSDILGKEEYYDEFMTYMRIALNLPGQKKFMNDWLRSLQDFYWDDEKQVFTRIWNTDTITEAIKRMKEWKEPSPEVPDTDEDEVEYIEARTTPSPELVPVHIPKSKEKTPPLKRKVVPSWQHLLSEELDILNYNDYIKVCKVFTLAHEKNKSPFERQVELLSKNDLIGWISKVLPYFVQKIKMWGCFGLEAQEIKCLVTDIDEVKMTQVEQNAKKKPRFRRKADEKENKNSDDFTILGFATPLSRIDLLTCIINGVDMMVAQDILRNLAMFPLALPLIIPNLFEENKSINLKHLLKHIPIRWKIANGDINENFLFSSPFKLILALRLGKIEHVGKSCILNHVLRRKYTFSSKQEPGASFGQPLSLPGFVEFIPLTEETCSSELWSSVIQHEYNSSQNGDVVLLLANFHGDPSRHPEAFRTMLKMASGVVVFTMQDSDEESCGRIWDTLSETFGTDQLPFLDVTDSKNSEDDEETINTRDLNNDATLRKVRLVIQKALALEKKQVEAERNESEISLTDEICCKESVDLVELLRSSEFRDIKNCMFNEPSVKPENVRILSKFCSLLKRPLRERTMGLIHLERELTELTNENSIAIRNELVRLENEMLQTVAISDSSMMEMETKKIELRAQLFTQQHLLDENNLGLEHFYRTLGKNYEAAVLNLEDPILSLDLPKYYAELLINGHSIELLDGESNKPSTSANWFLAITENVNAIFPNLRIFVVSVIGLQSSGKSTLLNSLFGCKFAVSMGRCTRGLFIRLLFLEEELVERLQVDAILLIDMEGLGAPEKVNDPEAERKDRLMTTFVMGISNLTLINISGEASNSMTDILQIAIVAMARLDDVKLSPDVFVVQHLSEKNLQKLQTAHGEFIKAIEKAIKLTEGKGIYIGIQDSICLKNLIHRARKGNVLKAFGPFRHGEFINSPPSVGYHESIIDLLESILEACEECESKTNFDRWSRFLEGYLDAVYSENRVVIFKNLLEMCEHLVRGDKILYTKEAIEKAFRHHVEYLKTVIRLEIQEFQKDKSQREMPELISNMEAKLNTSINSNLSGIPQHCSHYQDNVCNYCDNAIGAMDSLYSYVRGTTPETDTIKTISTFIEETMKNYCKNLSNMIGAELMQQGHTKEFYEIIHNSLLRFDVNSTRTEEEREDVANKVWLELKTRIGKRYPCESLNERIVRDLIVIYESYPTAAQRYKSPQIPVLENELAYRSKSAIQDIFISGAIFKPLKPTDCFELKTRLNKLPEKFVQKHKVQQFVPGMMMSVKAEIDDAIKEFEEYFGNDLIGSFRWDCHIYGLKKFELLFHSLEKRYESSQQPLKILEKNEEFYKKLIKTRLSYGFSTVGEGSIITDLLLNAIAERVTMNVEAWRVGKVLDEPWIINAENVRLKFLSKLAQQVERNQKEEALAYFTSPEQVITDWFTSEVDAKFVLESNCMVASYFTAELTKVCAYVRGWKSLSEIKPSLDAYFAQVGSIMYESTKLLVQEGADESSSLDLLKSTILAKLQERKSDCMLQIKVKLPSESKEVMRKLGCTEQCFWCGALCWGQRGHDKNQDSTKNHHACHQPSGLFAVVHNDSDVLMDTPCHDLADKMKVYWGAFRKKGMKWYDAKNHPDFSNWLFERHSKTEFNQLMYWFFLKLNKELAERNELKPAPDSVFKKETYKYLNCETILQSIKKKLKSAD